MIRSAALLVRTSWPSVLFLAASVFVLLNVLSGEPDETAGAGPGSIPSLAPLARRSREAGAVGAAQHSALFDPGRRPETVSGSIDDLRPNADANAAAPVSIVGVLLDGRSRKAMLAVGTGTAAWAAVGGDVGGWRVASVDADGAVLERDGQSLALKVADRYKLRSKAPPDGAPGVPPTPDGIPPGATPISPLEPPTPPDAVNPPHP